MINITDDFTYIILVGDVFLKDAVRIELKKQGDYCRLTKIVGSGKKYEKIESEKIVDNQVFDRLVDVIHHLELDIRPTEYEREYYANEELSDYDDDDDDLVEWMFVLVEGEEKLICAITGSNPIGSVFNSICDALSSECIDFNDVRLFYREFLHIE